MLLLYCTAVFLQAGSVEVSYPHFVVRASLRENILTGEEFVAPLSEDSHLHIYISFGS